MIPMNLEIDATELARAPKALSRAYIAAGKRAVSRTGKWARTHVTRAIAQADNIPQKTFKRGRRVNLRIRTFAGEGTPGISARLWVGILPIHAGYLGKPRQTRKGASVRGRKFPGAFVAQMRSGHVGIFKRAGKARLPIVEQDVELTHAESAIAGVRAQIPARLKTEMTRELNYQLNVKGLK